MTTLLAVIGHPIAHSLSPRMHAAAIDALGLDAAYLAVDVAPERLDRTVRELSMLGAIGFNVTLPHKETIVSSLDAIDGEARAIGAVNTVVREDGRWVGTNTDARGMVRSIEEAGVEVQGRRATVIGAGGAARAAAYGLALGGASRVTIVARRRDRADALARAMAIEAGAACVIASADMEPNALRRELSHSDLLVQATSATMQEEQGEELARVLPIDAMPKAGVVVDLVYRPRRTAVLAIAAGHGLVTIDGVGMLVHQGALALERWTGVAAPIGVMRDAVISGL